MAGNWVNLLTGIIALLMSIGIIMLVLLQQGRRSGINSAIGGGAESFLSKSKSRSIDATLRRVTKWALIFMFLLLVAINAINILR